MAIKVKAVERQLKVGKDAGSYRFMLQAEIYNTLSAQKVISEAAVRSGIPEGALSAAWDAIGQVVKVWATEGHSIAIPGLGRMRFGVRATTVDDVNKVSNGLITTDELSSRQVRRLRTSSLTPQSTSPVTTATARSSSV